MTSTSSSLPALPCIIVQNQKDLFLIDLETKKNLRKIYSFQESTTADFFSTLKNVDPNLVFIADGDLVVLDGSKNFSETHRIAQSAIAEAVILLKLIYVRGENKYYAVLVHETSITLWDVLEGKKVMTHKLPSEGDAYDLLLTSKYLFYCMNEVGTILVSRETGEVALKLPYKDSTLKAQHFAGYQKVLFVDGKTVVILDLSNLQYKTFDVQVEPKTVVVDAGKQALYCFTDIENGTVHVHDLVTGELKQKMAREILVADARVKHSNVVYWSFGDSQVVLHKEDGSVSEFSIEGSVVRDVKFIDSQCKTLGVLYDSLEKTESSSFAIVDAADVASRVCFDLEGVSAGDEVDTFRLYRGTK